MGRGGTLKPPWKKGQSGNPKGGPGPRGTRITDYIVDVLDERDSNGKTNSERIARAVIRKAAKADMHAVGHITDRTEGKTPSRVELTGSDGGPLEFADARSRLLERLARGTRRHPPDAE